MKLSAHRALLIVIYITYRHFICFSLGTASTEHWTELSVLNFFNPDTQFSLSFLKKRNKKKS